MKRTGPQVEFVGHYRHPLHAGTIVLLKLKNGKLLI